MRDYLDLPSMAPIGLAVILPLDVTADALPSQDGVASLSMANVVNDNGRIWAHGLFTVFCTIVCFPVLYRLYRKVFLQGL